MRPYEVGSEHFPGRDEPQGAPLSSVYNLQSHNGIRVTVNSNDPATGTALSLSGQSPTTGPFSSAGAISNSVVIIDAPATSLRHHRETVVAQPDVQEADNASNSGALSAAGRLETVTQYNRLTEDVSIIQDRLTRLEKHLVNVAKARAKECKIAESAKPIDFRDAIGRKFSFPFHSCRTWAVSLTNSR